MHDCNLSWQAFASSACQSVNSVFQTQRCKPLSESLLFARRGCRSRFGDSAESRQNVKRAGHWWFSGRILASHAGDPGSILGQCIVVMFVLGFAGPRTEECYSPRDGQKSKRTERLTHIYLLYILKRTDSRFLKGQAGPFPDGKAVPWPSHRS